MSPIAIAFGVLELTGSAQQTSLVVAAQTTAMVLVLLFGGALADRGHRQRILVLADLTASLSQACVAALFLTGRAEIGWLVLLAACNGAASGMNLPTMTGFITQVVPRERLHDANALLGAARSAAFTVGAAIAGILVATLGAGWTVAIDACTYLVSAVLIAGVRANEQVKAQGESMLSALRTGWTEFVAQRWLWVVVLQFTFVVAGVQSFYGLIGPTYAQRMLDGARDWGFAAASFGVGTLVGGLFALRVRVRYPMRLAVACVFGGALPVSAALLSLGAVGLAAAAFANGMASQTFSVLWNTAVQQRVPPESLSRVSAFDYLGSICGAPLGLIVSGWLLDHGGVQPALVLAWVLVVVPTVAALCVRDVRRLERLEWNSRE